MHDLLKCNNFFFNINVLIQLNNFPFSALCIVRGGGGQLSRCQKPQIPLSWITAEPRNLWQHFSHFAWGQRQPSMTSSSAYHHLSPHHCREDQTCWNWSWLWRRASSCTSSDSSTWSALQQCSLKPSSEVSSCGSRNGGCCDGSWDLMKWSRGRQEGAKKSEAMLQMTTSADQLDIFIHTYQDICTRANQWI